MPHPEWGAAYYGHKMYGIFFSNNNFNHIANSIEAAWGEMGVTKVRICSYNDLKSAIFPVQSQENHDHSQIIIAKTSRT